MKSVGKQLQEARLAKNWTPELAARETKIKVDRLRDLEADDYSHFTSPAYARGFVRTYARSLGLDEYKILRQLDNKLPDDDTPNLVTDSSVAYLPETSMPPRVAHRNFAGLYIVMTLGCMVFLIIAFVLFQAYRVGELPRYFARDANPEGISTPTDTNSTPGNPEVESSHKALPVDSNTPPPAVATADDTNNIPGAVKALPVDASELANATNAAPNPGDDTLHAVKALPVDPSELTNAPPVTPTGNPSPADSTKTTTAPITTATDANAPPRALPVDLNQLNATNTASSSPATNVAFVPAASPPVPPVVATTASARQSNAGPVMMPALPPAAPSTAPLADAPPATTLTNAAPQTAAGADKRLVLTASQDSFVRVTLMDATNADKPLYASVLHSGESVGFDGHKFTVNVGIPSAVDIKLDGVNHGPHSDQITPQTFVLESSQP